MKKNMLVLILPLVFPFLLANSPSPYPYPNIYYGFTYTPIDVSVQTGQSVPFLYSTQITNTGLGYMDMSSFLFQSQENQENSIYVYQEGHDNEFLLPGGIFFLTFDSEFYIDDLMLPYTYAFTPDEEEISVTLNGDLSVFDDDHFQIPVLYSAELDAYFTAVIHLTLDTQPLVISSTSIINDAIIFSHPSLNAIEINRLTVESIVLIRGRTQTDGNWSFMFYILGIGALLTMFISGLFLAAFVFVILWLFKKLLKH